MAANPPSRGLLVKLYRLFVESLKPKNLFPPKPTVIGSDMFGNRYYEDPLDIRLVFEVQAKGRDSVEAHWAHVASGRPTHAGPARSGRITPLLLNSLTYNCLNILPTL